MNVILQLVLSVFFLLYLYLLMKFIPSYFHYKRTPVEYSLLPCSILIGIPSYFLFKQGDAVGMLEIFGKVGITIGIIMLVLAPYFYYIRKYKPDKYERLVEKYLDF